MFDILKSRNDFLKEDVIEFTKQLIQCKSHSLHEDKTADLCEKKMKELGYDKVFKDSSGNVIGIIYGRKYSPTVLLNCHMDTVVPSDETKWINDPYNAVEKDNKIYGLGSSDCKSGLAAQIFTGALLKNSLLPLNGNLVVAATVAEENGLSIGIKSLIKNTLVELNLNPDYVILGEPTDLNIYYGHDGWAQYDILIDGKDGNEVINSTNKIYENFNSIYNSINNNGFELENLLVKKNDSRESRNNTYNEILCSKRLTSNEQYTDFLKQVNSNCNLLSVQSNINVKVKVHEEKQKLYTGINTITKYVSNAWETDPFSFLIQRSGESLEAAGLKVKRGKWKLRKLRMGTAGNVISNEFNIPVIGYGPGDENEAHAINEYVGIDKISDCVYGTASIVHGLIGVPVFGWTSDEI